MTSRDHILIASRAEYFLYTTATLLRQEGYECACAADARTAADMLRAARYDFLIIDTMMVADLSPGILDFLQSQEEFSVIVMVDVPTTWQAEHPLPSSMAVRIKKPIEFDEWLEEIRHILGRRPTLHPHSGARGHDAASDRNSLQVSVVNPEAQIIALVQQLSDSVNTLKQLIETRFTPKKSPPHLAEYGEEDPPPSSSNGNKNTLHEFDLTAWSPTLQAALKVLSPREQEILHLLYVQRRVSAIALALHISPHTVRNHLKSIFRKLGVNSQIELIACLGQNSPGH